MDPLSRLNAFSLLRSFTILNDFYHPFSLSGLLSILSLYFSLVVVFVLTAENLWMSFVYLYSSSLYDSRQCPLPIDI